MKKAILAVVTLCFCAASFAASTITTRVEDPKAIYLDAPATAGDNSAALQAAIDKVSGTGREGIVFVPAGRYTMTRSVFLWPGVRLIGYGATRPVFVLPPNTPGFQKGMGVMVMFTGLTPHEHPRAGNRIAFPPPGSIISYGLPAFSLSKPFFGYAAFKGHLSVLPFSGSLLDSFAEELKPYSRSKGSLHLPFNRPLPATLIRRLVRARVAALSLQSAAKV